MAHPKDNIHYAYIPIKGNTKAWFKKDWQTIRKSFSATLRNSHIIGGLAALFVFLILYFQNTLMFINFFWLFICFYPIFLFGYFMLKVLKDKGYDIKAHF